MKEFLKEFFANYELFDRDINSESYNSKFAVKIGSLNEIFERNIKQSTNDMERLIYVFYYMDAFFSTFVAHLKILGYNTTNLSKSNLRVLRPLRQLREKKVVVFNNDDSINKIMIENRLHNFSGKIDETLFETEDLEAVHTFFDFSLVTIRYFEAFSQGDMELKKILEKGLTKTIIEIIKT